MYLNIIENGVAVGLAYESNFDKHKYYHAQHGQGWVELEYKLPEGEVVDDSLIYQQLAKDIRKKRDKLLAETDFYLLPDVPTQPPGLLEYRSALRDIPDQDGFPFSVEWPVL